MRALLVGLIAFPGLAFAAGGNDWNPPTPTGTTKTCKGAQVWDERTGKCADAKQSSLDAGGLYRAVRELAYAGRYGDAQAVLAAMPDQSDSRVLTYWGFTHRKLGRRELAGAFYEQAIAADPDNLLARSYMGQGYIEEGKLGFALAQWQEIRGRGGAGSWPEAALRLALETGQTASY